MSRSTFIAKYGSEKHIREVEPDIDSSTSIREAVAKNQFTPTDIVDKYAYKHHEFLGHPNMSKGVYENIMHNGDLTYDAKLNAIGSPHFNETHMDTVGLGVESNPNPKTSLISKAVKSNFSSHMLDHLLVPHITKELDSWNAEDLSKNQNLQSHHIDTILTTPSKRAIWSKLDVESNGPDPISMQYIIAHPSFTKDHIAKISSDKVRSPWITDALYKKFGKII